MSSVSGFTPRVQLDGVWKKFRRGEVHDSLRDLIPALVRRSMGRGSAGLRREEFWALQDVSFTVEAGQTMGIIGANGAGKSTLLKVLTRILRPTLGSYTVNGRIGALIEVAAGFHPDLTGRENIFLQGAIMGMESSYTRRRLDEIVAFSEIEDFIDTPVKRYSSGMNARLGFSIAAHLDPDVLIIDEVLAVGDHEFQKKAFGRIREMSRSGLPVVVVSHQLDRIAELCTQAVLLSHGAVVAIGNPADVISAYMRGTAPASTTASTSPVIISSVEGVGSVEVRSGDCLRVRVSGAVRVPLERHIEAVALVVRSAQTGELVFVTGTSVHEVGLEPGDFALDVSLRMNVQPGIYLIDTGVYDRASEAQLYAGPGMTVRVLEGSLFLGPTNLNATIGLARSAPSSV
ncbi:MAG TPA: polysaccharide ABC transporter ATP-binding protein [Gemmatimonadaceae bacterium]|jgi:lipopolysaccharide transport system ATP-binding protein